MNYIKKHIEAILETLFLIYIYFACRLPMRDFDIWFHLKSGELFVNQGHLQFTEVFSYAAQGRSWFPYEWGFQVFFYLLKTFVGSWIFPWIISLFVVVMFYCFLRILKDIFNLSAVPRLLLGFLFFVSIYEFNTVRPHVLSYTLFTINLLLIFARIFKGKKWIFFTPLITLIWSNWHSTAFLSWGIMLAYGSIIFLQWLITKKKDLIPIFKDLFIFALINLVVTILPPLGIRDYKLLWEFFIDQKFLSSFIAEWSPLSQNPAGFIIYSVLSGTAIIFFLVGTIKKRAWLESLIGLPLILMVAMGFTASRNLVLGSLGLFLLAGIGLKYLLIDSSRKLIVWLWLPLAFSLTAFHIYVLYMKSLNVSRDRLYYPVQSTEFVKRYLNGRMFNDYTYGGYILYNVYPKLQVFIDGRADVYHYYEMRDYQEFAIYKFSPDSKYLEFLNSFWDKYQVDFTILAVAKHTVMRRVADLLNNDPSWALVFWDDDSEVFVKRNGKNDEIIKTLDTKYATPYLRDPYVKGKMDEALSEYKRMDAIAKSARTSNAVGYILMQKGQFDEAKQKFEEAINLNPTFESPYMNLAELSAKDGNITLAIKLYKDAKTLAPDRGLIYIRLGQLMLQNGEDKNKVIKLWQDGVKNTVDEDAKQKLKELISIL